MRFPQGTPETGRSAGRRVEMVRDLQLHIWAGRDSRLQGPQDRCLSRGGSGGWL